MKQSDQRNAQDLRLTLDPGVRRGAKIKVIGVGGLADHVTSPVFATPVGLALYAHRNRPPDQARGGGSAFSRMTGRLRGIFKEFF